MLIFRNAKVFDGQKFLPGLSDVTIDGKHVASITNGEAVDGATVIDLAGMTLMPGLITGHMHADVYKFTFDHAKHGVMLGTELPPGVLMAIAIRTCGILIESGFTGFIGASCSNSNDAQLKIAMAEGIMQGPRIRACGHHISAAAGVNEHSKWWMRTHQIGQDLFGTGPLEMRKLVREDIRQGAQTIKIYATGGHGFPGHADAVRDMSLDEIEAIVDAAHERGAKVRAHVSSKAGIIECIQLGVDIIDHGDNIDEECIDLMVKAGTFWIPSIFGIKVMLDIGIGDGELMSREYENVRRMLPIAQKAGVKILAGDDYLGLYKDFLGDDPTDHKVGNYARELAFYSEVEGLSSTDVLTWATKNPGELLAEHGDKVGVIAPGALADIIIVDGAPDADIGILSSPEQHLKAVLRDGDFLIDRIGNDEGRRRVA